MSESNCGEVNTGFMQCQDESLGSKTAFLQTAVLQKSCNTRWPVEYRAKVDQLEPIQDTWI